MSLINRKEADIDITRNIKIIEALKAKVLSDVAEMYKNIACNMREDSREEIAENAANLIISNLLLCKRLGITYNTIGLKIEKKVKLGIVDSQEEEKYYGDLTELADYLKTAERK